MFDKLAYDRDESVKLFFFWKLLLTIHFFSGGAAFAPKGLYDPSCLIGLLCDI
jgi:hypothetical protein